MPPSLPSSPNGNYLISPELPRGLTSNDSCDGDFNPQAPVGPDLGGALKGTIAERRGSSYLTPNTSSGSIARPPPPLPVRGIYWENIVTDTVTDSTMAPPSPRKRR